MEGGREAGMGGTQAVSLGRWADRCYRTLKTQLNGR